jgi:hypothetical protein
LTDGIALAGRHAPEDATLAVTERVREIGGKYALADIDVP